MPANLQISSSAYLPTHVHVRICISERLHVYISSWLRLYNSTSPHKYASTLLHNVYTHAILIGFSPLIHAYILETTYTHPLDYTSTHLHLYMFTDDLPKIAIHLHACMYPTMHVYIYLSLEHKPLAVHNDAANTPISVLISTCISLCLSLSFSLPTSLWVSTSISISVPTSLTSTSLLHLVPRPLPLPLPLAVYLRLCLCLHFPHLLEFCPDPQPYL